MSDVFTDWLVSKVGDTTSLIERMKKEGWVPVTPERQPYTVDLCPQICQTWRRRASPKDSNVNRNKIEHIPVLAALRALKVNKRKPRISIRLASRMRQVPLGRTDRVAMLDDGSFRLETPIFGHERRGYV